MFCLSHDMKMRLLYAAVLLLLLLVVILVCLLTVITILFTIKDSSDDQTVPLKLPITHTETMERLPKVIQPIWYRLTLEVRIHDPPMRTTNGSIAMEFKCNNATDKIYLNYKNMSFGKIIMKAINLKSAPKVTNYELLSDVIIIELSQKLKLNGFYVIELYFKGVVNVLQYNGLYISSYKNENNTLVEFATTQMQPVSARAVFPCIDDPAFKAHFTIALIHRQNYTAISNMEVEEVVEERPNWMRSTFKKSVKMSTYLIAFVISDLVQINTTVDNLLFRAWADPLQIYAAQYAIDTAPKLVKFYENMFNISFPLNKIDMVAIEKFSGGAMENWGLITFREVALLVDYEANYRTQEMKACMVISHEIAHQWFGNLVSPEWWNDLWLNEGFASFIEYAGMDFVEPSWSIWDYFLLNEFFQVLLPDSLMNSHAVLTDEKLGVYQITSLFDKITYSKSASIIYMLRDLIGNITFKNGLIYYLNKYKYSSATSNNLWDALQWALKNNSNFGKNAPPVTDFMNNWIKLVGYPVVNVFTDFKNSSITFSQKHFLAGAWQEALNQYWHVSIQIQISDAEPSEKYWFFDNNLTIPLKKLDSSKDWILANPNSMLLYRVNYDLQNWRNIIKAIESDINKFSINDRAVLLDNSFSLAQAGYVTYEVPLKLSQIALLNKEIITWGVFRSKVKSILNLIYDRSEHASFTEYVKKITQKAFMDLSWEVPKTLSGEMRQEIIARMACIDLEIADCIDKSLRMFQKWKENNTYFISHSLKKTVFCTSVMHDNSVYEYFYNMLVNNTLNKDHLYLKALFCTRNPVQIRVLISKFLADDEGFPINLLQEVFQELSENPIGKSLLWYTFSSSFEKINAHFHDVTFVIPILVEAATSGLHDIAELRLVEDFMRVHNDSIGNGKSAFAQAIEIIENKIFWRQKVYPNFVKSLKMVS